MECSTALSKIMGQVDNSAVQLVESLTSVSKIMRAWIIELFA